MLTEEEWENRDGEEKKLLLTREEWLRKTNEKGSRQKGRGRFDKSNIKCFNCNIYGHFSSDCKKPRRNRGTNEAEANMAVMDNEPALLLAKHDNTDARLLVNTEKPASLQLIRDGEQVSESNIWYLDNGASNHMTGFRGKFTVLDENITSQVRLGDGSIVEI